MFSLLLRKEDGMTKQPWKILPGTTLGKWSVVLIVAMPLLFVIGTSFTNSIYKSVPAGGTILADIAVRPALALTMLAGMAAGISAFITGLLAIIRQKERALLVFVSSLIGALLLLFLAGEIFSPH
jgi:Na+/melibiose symporter-like transporter